MRYIIIDLEATCWPENQSPERMEIIEIGAVIIPSPSEPPISEFTRFIKPVREPLLSDFCQQLTSISQADVDNAPIFPVVFQDLLNWIGDTDYHWCSWGAYDLEQLRIDCRRHQVLFPPGLQQHINLKKEFGRLFQQQRCGMMTALKYLGLKHQGTHHRGLDDARNIARIANIVLPRLTLD